MEFPELTGLGLIFVVIAIFGYIISDTYKNVRNFGIPDTYKTDLENFFHYLSKGIIAISFLIIFSFASLASPNRENFITKSLYEFINVFDKLHGMGIITDYYYTLIPKVYILAVYPSLALLTIWSITLVLSLFFKFSQAFSIRVFLKGKEQPINALDLISESDQFFYISKQGGLWAAIRKEDIEKIEAVNTPSLLDKVLERNFINITKYIKIYKDKIVESIKTLQSKHRINLLNK